jgi:exodeoxyribonuclease-3
VTGTWQLPLIAPPGTVHQADPDVIRLLIFNTQHASPARARRQVAWIASQQNADLVILTEVGAGPGGHALTSALAEHGYQSVLAPEPSAPDYRTVIASRGPDLTAAPAGIPILGHRAPAAVVSYAGQQIGLLGLYVPSRGPRERRNQAKRAFQGAVTSALPGFTARFNAPVIVAGDLNVVEPGHIPHHAVFGEWEYDFYRSFAGAGLADAYRLLHPDEAAHSWYGRSGEGYRFDHAFITASHRAHVRDCRYLHEPRQHGLTDHAAMILAITVAEPPVSQVFDSLVATPPPAEMRPIAAQNEANPLEPKNLLDCQAKVRETGADIGPAAGYEKPREKDFGVCRFPVTRRGG